MMTPVKPSSSRRMSCTAAESEAGALGSMHSTTLWETSTNSAPASIPASNGRKSDVSNVSIGRES